MEQPDGAESTFKRYYANVCSYFGKLREEKPDRHIELFLAVVIAIFAFIQLYTTVSNNGSTTRQTSQLIDAANINSAAARQIAQASKRNATAAEKFATAAGNINTGVSNAVTKLNLQVGELKESAAQTARLARNTETANEVAKEALEVQTRPWLNIEGEPFNERGQWTLSLGNYGVSPAILAEPNFVTSNIGEPKPRIDRWTKELTEELCGHPIRKFNTPIFHGKIGKRPIELHGEQPGYRYLYGCFVYYGPSIGGPHYLKVAYFIDYFPDQITIKGLEYADSEVE